ncbi:hypothetical protein LP7551_05280 [Roseibium album]|nr:hypothetical protein LP7551_05280 [Roseibium album]
MQDNDPWEDRKSLTFEQAEGAASLPQQLQLKEVSSKLRAVLWRIVHDSLSRHRKFAINARRPHLIDPWDRILRSAHTFRDHRMIDEYEEHADTQISKVKQIFSNGDYLEIFGWLQYVLRNNPPHGFANAIDTALNYCHAAYRVFDHTTIVPFSSEEELHSIEKAFAELATKEFQGARAHLKKSLSLLSEGNNADNIRESIHAVESIARTLDNSGKFSRALACISNKTNIHRSMEAGFKSLYGYTSDENGIRHPLLDDDEASVDETDALFMIGACASFVTYLINKSRAAGLLD